MTANNMDEILTTTAALARSETTAFPDGTSNLVNISQTPPKKDVNEPCLPFALIESPQERRDSNPQPSVLETDTLPIELHSYSNEPTLNPLENQAAFVMIHHGG